MESGKRPDIVKLPANCLSIWEIVKLIIHLGVVNSMVCIYSSF